MSLYENWVKMAYDKNGTTIKKVWDEYVPKEQRIYERLLSQKITNISGTVAELGAAYDMSAEYICGFLDGINEAVKTPLEIAELTEDTAVSIDIDFEELYKKMVQYKAEHLFRLKQWDGIFTEDDRKRLYNEQKISSTYFRETEKIGRNDLCPCGSGKKYKRCCANK